MGKKEDLIEANKRGLLTGQLKQDFDLAVQRGLIESPNKDYGISRDIKPKEKSANIAEAGLTLLTGSVAEPIAGILGLAKTITSGPAEGAKTIEQAREGLTYKPKTESGISTLKEIGEFVSPVTELLSKSEAGFGDIVYEKTGSPALASAATTMPTVIMELLGVGLVKGSGGALNRLKELRRKGKIVRAIDDAVPTINVLKDTARGLYKEIDGIGGVVKPNAYRSLVKNINNATQKAGIDPDITPKSHKALKRLIEKINSNVTVTELDTLRKVARNALDPSNPSESNLSRIITDQIDDFMDNSSQSVLKPTGMQSAEIGKKYKIARDLWGRARRSEIIQEAFEKARIQASGFENGIRAQFRSILNNKKTRKYFNQTELDEIKKVVKGDRAANLARLIGKLGFTDTGASNLIGGSIGAGFGAYVAGVPGAVAVPLIGQVSKKLARRLTEKGAQFADRVIRAGKDANAITKAYMDFTPKKLRDPSDLAQLLMSRDINLTRLPNTPFIDKVIEAVKGNRSSVTSGVVGGEIVRAIGETQTMEMDTDESIYRPQIRKTIPRRP